MIDDLKTLIREFDLMAILRPESGGAFLTNLILLAIMLGSAYVAWAAVRRLF